MVQLKVQMACAHQLLPWRFFIILTAIHCAMGDWDSYCALCATMTSASYEDGHIGTLNPVMLAIRRRIIALERQRVESGERTYASVSFEEAEEYETLADDEIDWDWDDENCSYDPTLVNDANTDWQNHVRCLGLNMETGK